MTILLLGANGQVGHELRRALAPLGGLVAVTRDGRLADGGTAEVGDLADAEALVALLDRVRPRCIVNAAAYTAVDRAETEADAADRANHVGVGVLGDWAARHAAQVVHYSTDYVFDGSGFDGSGFDGSAVRAYREDDATAPLGAYGRSKLAGEQALAASGAEHLIFRTAWVYAARGANFLRTMLRLAGERDELRVVTDQVGSPTPAWAIADATAAVLAWQRANGEAARRSTSGLYHMTAGGQCSWFDFASAILREAHAAGLIARVPRVLPITTADYPTPARRPAWSVLENAKLAQTFGVRLPEWNDGLRRVIAELAAA